MKKEKKNEDWEREFEELWEGHTPFAGYDNEGIKDFIRQLLESEKEKSFNEGEKNMAKGVLRRIKSGRNLGHIELLCRAVAETLKEQIKKEL